jgi:hypothetical protein
MLSIRLLHEVLEPQEGASKGKPQPKEGALFASHPIARLPKGKRQAQMAPIFVKNSPMSLEFVEVIL